MCECVCLCACPCPTCTYVCMNVCLPSYCRLRQNKYSNKQHHPHTLCMPMSLFLSMSVGEHAHKNVCFPRLQQNKCSNKQHHTHTQTIPTVPVQLQVHDYVSRWSMCNAIEMSPHKWCMTCHFCKLSQSSQNQDGLLSKFMEVVLLKFKLF